MHDDSNTDRSQHSADATLAALLAVDPAREDAPVELARILRDDAALLAHVAAVVGSEDGAAAAQPEACVLRLGPSAVRTLSLALSLPVRPAERSRSARWTLAIARAVASRAISRQMKLGGPAEAFALALVAAAEPDAIARWNLPARLVQAVAPHARGERGFDPDEGESEALRRILDHAALVAEALTGPAGRRADDATRVAGGLDALREILEVERPAFAVFFERIGREWIEWCRRFGLEAPCVPTLADVRSVGGAAQPEDVVRALDAASAAPLQALQILAVDDDPVSLKILERTLRKAGHETISATNGSDALRIALEQHPHAVIADWMMPELDGLELCRALRRSELGRNVFFLLLTGRGEEDRVVEAFDAGVDDYVTKPFNARILMARLKGGQRVIELQERVEANRRVVLKQVAEMGLLTRKLRNAAHTDALTELPNRRHAMSRLESEWEVSRATGRPLSAILIDIDHFKKVNDTHGHDVGDLVLRDVAHVLRATTRGGEEVARLGGEEFFVTCPHTSEAQALVAAERLRSAVERHTIRGLGFEGSVTISVGVAQRSAAMTTHDALIKAADQAVYAAKAGGRNRVVCLGSQDALLRSA